MSRFNAASDPERLIRDVEHRVQQYPFRSIRITGRGDELLGLFLLSQEVRLTDRDLQSALAAIFKRQAEDPLLPAAPGGPEAPSADRIGGSRLEEVLASQIEQTRQTRMPCALILLEIGVPGDSPLAEEVMSEITRRVQAAVRRSDILLRCDTDRLAMILPSISLREATDCAERIRRTLAEELALGDDRSPALTASIGIGLCYAGDRLSAETFASSVTRELARARQQGGNRVCRVIDSRDDCSCQVSVEERTELFGIFMKDRQS